MSCHAACWAVEYVLCCNGCKLANGCKIETTVVFVSINRTDKLGARYMSRAMRQSACDPTDVANSSSELNPLTPGFIELTG